MGFADTKWTKAGVIPTTTTTSTTTTTTEEPTTTTTTTREPTTAYTQNDSTINVRSEALTATSAKVLWNTNQAKQTKRQWIRYIDQFGEKHIIDVGAQATQKNGISISIQ